MPEQEMKEPTISPNDVTFFDLAPGSAVVTIGTTKLTVHAVPFSVLLDLCAKFPLLQTILSGDKDAKVNVVEALGYGGDAIGNLIAAAMRHPYDQKYIDQAKTFDFDTILDFVNGIFEATMPNGPGPFKAKIDKIKARMSVEEVESSAPGAPAPSPSAGVAANDQGQKPKFERLKMTANSGPRSLDTASPETSVPQ
jgi:hypothetical protein